MTSVTARPRRRARTLPTLATIAALAAVGVGAAGEATAAPLSSLPAPSGVTATAAPGAVTVRFKAVTGAASYVVTRRDAAHRLVRTPVRTTSSVDRTVRPRTAYTYRVLAVDRAGRSSATSSPVRVTSGPAAPAPAPTPTPAPAPTPTPTPTTTTAPAPTTPAPTTPAPSTPAPAPSTGTLPAASRFVRPGGATSGPCTAAQPCGSFEAAWRAAAAGDVVEVAGGTYPGASLQPVARGTAPVTFRPSPGASVTTGQLLVFGSHLEVRDMTVRGWYAKPGSSDLTFRRLDVPAAFFITSASDIRILGGSVGPADSVDPQIKASDTSGAPVPTDVLIDGVDFRDFTRKAEPTNHVECLQTGAGRRITVRNSTFRGCATQGIFFRSFGGTAAISDVTIENNAFAATTEGYYAIRISDNGQRYPNLRVAYNSSLQPFSIDPEVVSGLSVVGNVAPMRDGACVAGGRYSHNVWDGTTCSSTDRDAPSGFVSAGSFDLRLTPGAAARGAGDPGDHPATDRLGVARPQGGAVDAGAYEG